MIITKIIEMGLLVVQIIKKAKITSRILIKFKLSTKISPLTNSMSANNNIMLDSDWILNTAKIQNKTAIIISNAPSNFMISMNNY